MVCCSTVTSTWSTWSHHTICFPSASLTGWHTSDRYCKTLESPFTCSKMCVNQSLLTHSCSSHCCHLQNRGCPRPSECPRVLLSDKLLGRQWKRWSTSVKICGMMSQWTAALSFQNDNHFEGACWWVPEHRHGCGEADVSGFGAVYFTEGDKPVERGRKVPAEPRLHPGSPQLLLGLLLLRAALHRGESIFFQSSFRACWNERCFLCTRVQELEEFWPFRALLTELTRRLSYCVTAELIPLMEVAGVMEVSVEVQRWELISMILSLHPDYSSIIRFDWTGLISLNFIEHIIFFLQSRAKQLYNAGYKTLSHLANADPAVLSKTIENLYKKQANQIVASARVGDTITWVLPH